MHGWGVVDLRVNLAKKNHGYSIPARSYDFCPHLTQLDILDFTLSHKGWEATFLIRAFGLSEELSAEVGFPFFNNSLKSQDIRFRMKKKNM